MISIWASIVLQKAVTLWFRSKCVMSQAKYKWTCEIAVGFCPFFVTGFLTSSSLSFLTCNPGKAICSNIIVPS